MPWYKLPHTDIAMHFDHERPDLVEVEAPKQAAAERKAAEVKVKAEGDAESG